MNMKQLTEIEIAKSVKPLHITEIADELGIFENEIELYGESKAKIKPEVEKRLKDLKNGKLILVTAINPTPAGEGKTTVSIGLGDALSRLGKKAIIAIREPSLGPVFGIKGGAAGGGYSQVIPMEDINLHFTGDMHAISAANNLLAAMLDNHIHHGNSLNIDIRRITWKRAVDMNDRQLRNITDGLGGRFNGVPREDGFDITVASEVMAVLCLALDMKDLKRKLSNIVVGYTKEDEPVTCGDLKAQGAMALLLKDALKPNLVQTLEHTPALIHGGPFANIAHGCNSIIATKLALKLGEYVVTEAGFGADLGAEKFLDIKCRKAGISPDVVVIVATVRALKSHGGVGKDDLNKENLLALKKGMPNLFKHIENIKDVFGLPVVVAINDFPTDTKAEQQMIIDACNSLGVKAVLTYVWGKGGKGGIELGEEVIKLATEKSEFKMAYNDDMSLMEKMIAVATKIYGADGVDFSPVAKREILKLEKLGFEKLPICVAKTQYSLSDDAKLIGRPEGFKISVKDIKLSAGAGFIVMYTGNIMTMPGLPKIPSAEKMDISQDGTIVGLF